MIRVDPYFVADGPRECAVLRNAKYRGSLAGEFFGEGPRTSGLQIAAARASDRGPLYPAGNGS